MARFIEAWTFFKRPITKNDYYRMGRYFSLINLDNVSYEIETRWGSKIQCCIAFYLKGDKIFEERYEDRDLAVARMKYFNEFNADADVKGTIEFEGREYDADDVVMIKHTGPFKVFMGKNKNFYRIKLQTRETYVTIVNEGISDGFRFISSIQRRFIRQRQEG